MKVHWRDLRDRRMKRERKKAAGPSAAQQALATMLSSVGSWRVGSHAHHEQFMLVERARHDGLVTTRIHYGPDIPDGELAFELTDLGIARLALIAGTDVANDALAARQRYHRNAIKYAPSILRV